MTESLWFWWLKIIGKINYNLTKGIRMKSTSKSRIFQIVHNNSFKKQLLRPFSLQFQHRIYLSRHLNKVDIKVRLTIRTYSYAFHRCAVYFAIEWNCSQAPARIPTLERKFIKRRMSSMIPLDEHPVQVSDHNLTRHARSNTMSIEAADIHQHPRISNFHREPYVYRYIHRYNALWRDECTSTYIYNTGIHVKVCRCGRVHKRDPRVGWWGRVG